ncbi:MerR family transcriptional regulator [Nocardioides sp. GY 10113]|uniref:MerR family transcriptional regulator n=1 Tax=Nocardioides sp. GY 10113 TaxID=2569761 RepID=UPI0010A8222C|nr:MerR family transcriptional regulator [Nocardioides sp. GY 10113]TIC87932.1 MerR family transcriptional regulator [Nocardioides sp. GY 10113]
MSASPRDGADPASGPTGAEGAMTVDELSAAAGLTVRTTRYYASLGLIPPPERRGRVAWYGPEHLARLEMIRALQGHGFSLQAIDGYLASLPAGARIEDLAVQRAMLASWTTSGPHDLTRRQLDEHAGRRLSDEDLALIEEIGMLRRTETERGVRYTPAHGFDVTMRLLDLDIPVDGVRGAADAISRHMEALAAELTDVLREDVLVPLRHHRLSRDEAERVEQTLAELRQLTLEAIVTAFQRSANDLIARSLQRR